MACATHPTELTDTPTVVFIVALLCVLSGPEKPEGGLMILFGNLCISNQPSHHNCFPQHTKAPFWVPFANSKRRHVHRSPSALVNYACWMTTGRLSWWSDPRLSDPHKSIWDTSNDISQQTHLVVSHKWKETKANNLETEILEVQPLVSMICHLKGGKEKVLWTIRGTLPTHRSSREFQLERIH